MTESNLDYPTHLRLVASGKRLTEFYQAARLPCQLRLVGTLPDAEPLFGIANALEANLRFGIAAETEFANALLAGTATEERERFLEKFGTLTSHDIEQVEAVVPEVLRG